jgi:hypothetical protein
MSNLLHEIVQNNCILQLYYYNFLAYYNLHFPGIQELKYNNSMLQNYNFMFFIARIKGSPHKTCRLRCRKVVGQVSAHLVKVLSIYLNL